jgi:hypothetical protein
MITDQSCRALRAHFHDYANNTLAQEDREQLEAHMRTCESCRNGVKSLCEVNGLLHGAFDSGAVSRDFSDKMNKRLVSLATPSQALPDVEEEEPAGQPFMSESFSRRFAGAPWWAVSAAMHVLALLLATLISVTIELPKPEDALVTVTELAPAPVIKAEAKKPEVKAAQALESKHDTPPTDPTSKEASDIVVPPDILEKAELGDHFETINLDRPDTGSAFGNPDAHMFHSVKGSDDAAGGGGSGGSSLEDMIGVGGASSPGEGGGWGGGKGTGTGVDSGGGPGSFGNRNGGGRRLMVKKHGGSKATEGAVDLALKWLAYHQEPDGHWDSKKYQGGGGSDMADTGLALLAFLGAGHTEKVGEHKQTVLCAVAWLKSKQTANGLFENRLEGSVNGPGYRTAIATLALAEAAGMANVKETREAAQKAVDYCINIHQQGEGSEKGGWRYNAKTDPDISVAGWFIMAIKSAKVSGLAVDPASFEGAIKMLDKLEIKNVAQGSYGPASAFGYTTSNSPNGRRCAIGNLARQFLGWKKEDLQSSVEYFMEKYGTPDAGKEDLYYWYYGTLCVFQQGGDIWKKWNAGMKKSLCESQCKQGDDTGSWDPKGDYSQHWGRVGQTALGALCLEVYYRYQQLHQ